MAQIVNRIEPFFQGDKKNFTIFNLSKTVTDWNAANENVTTANWHAPQIALREICERDDIPPLIYFSMKNKT